MGVGIVSEKATIGEGTQIWHNAQVREGARIGANCIIGTGAYIGVGVVIGDRCKIQNYACVYQGAVVEDGVFIGPHAILANDRYPRAVTPSGELKGGDDWECGSILVREGAAIGAGAILLPDLVIGHWALVGAGSVVTESVSDYNLVIGHPAIVAGWVCTCGHPSPCPGPWTSQCPHCGGVRPYGNRQVPV